jgi:hypothetical protein
MRLVWENWLWLFIHLIKKKKNVRLKTFSHPMHMNTWLVYVFTNVSFSQDMPTAWRFCNHRFTWYRNITIETGCCRPAPDKKNQLVGNAFLYVIIIRRSRFMSFRAILRLRALEGFRIVFISPPPVRPEGSWLNWLAACTCVGVYAVLPPSHWIASQGLEEWNDAEGKRKIYRKYKKKKKKNRLRTDSQMRRL